MKWSKWYGPVRQRCCLFCKERNRSCCQTWPNSCNGWNRLRLSQLGLLPKVARDIVLACLGLYLLPRELGLLPKHKHKFEDLGDLRVSLFSLFFPFCHTLYRTPLVSLRDPIPWPITLGSPDFYLASPVTWFSAPGLCWSPTPSDSALVGWLRRWHMEHSLQ